GCCAKRDGNDDRRCLAFALAVRIAVLVKVLPCCVRTILVVDDHCHTLPLAVRVIFGDCLLLDAVVLVVFGHLLTNEFTVSVFHRVRGGLCFTVPFVVRRPLTFRVCALKEETASQQNHDKH